MSQPEEDRPVLELVQSLKQARAEPPIRIGKSRELTTPDDYRDYVREQLERPDFNGVQQHGRVDPDYSLVFDGLDPINIGDSLRDLPRIVRVLDAVGVGLDYCSPKAWAPVARCLVRLADVEGGDDPGEETLEWLASYLVEREMADLRIDVVADRAPFRHEGRVYLNRNRFVTFVNRSQGGKIPAAEIMRRLRRLGFEKANGHGVVTAHDREKKTKASSRYYVGPRDLQLPGIVVNVTDTEDSHGQ